MSLPVSLVGSSCQKPWQKRCWSQQGSNRISHLKVTQHLILFFSKASRWHRLGRESPIYTKDLWIHLQGKLYPKVICYYKRSSFQDETNFARMLSSVEKYAGRRPEETWGELQSRSSYKELVRQNIFRYHSIKKHFHAGCGLKRCARAIFEDGSWRTWLAGSSFSHCTQNWLQADQCSKLLSRFVINLDRQSLLWVRLDFCYMEKQNMFHIWFIILSRR